MSSVRIEDEAFGDRRYHRLATEAGLADADHARGKMAVLWRQCTIEQRHILPNQDVCDVLGPNGVEALVNARLGDIAEGGVRIRGTKGRIEWLKKLRDNGKKGGRPKKTKSKPSGFQESNPLTLALSPSLAQENLPSEDSAASRLADELRAAVLASKPNHRVGHSGWPQTRASWAKTLASTLKRRPEAAISAAIAHLAKSAGEPYAFVVESAKALDEKLDRIEQAMVRSSTPAIPRRDAGDAPVYASPYRDLISTAKGG